MKGILLILFVFLLIPTLGASYDFSGTIKDEGDGNYFVAAVDVYGHVYLGNAQDNGNDGTIHVFVQNAGRQSYSGMATDNDDGSYDLTLKSDVSDDEASGTLSKVY